MVVDDNRKKQLGRNERDKIRERALLMGQGSPRKCSMFAWAVAPLLNGETEPSREFLTEVDRIAADARAQARSISDFSFADFDVIAARTLKKLQSAAERHGEMAHREAWGRVLHGENPDRPRRVRRPRNGLPY